MDLKHSTLATTNGLVLGTSFGGQAALTTSAVLNFTPGTAPAETHSSPPSGSWFSFLAGNTDGDYYPDSNYYFPVSAYNGIHIGTIHSASGSHSATPGCDPYQSICTGAGGPGENPDIDAPWRFFGTTGLHLTTAPITEIGSTANGFVKSLDFSGWGLTYLGNFAPLGGDPANFLKTQAWQL